MYHLLNLMKAMILQYFRAMDIQRQFSAVTAKE